MKKMLYYVCTYMYCFISICDHTANDYDNIHHLNLLCTLCYDNSILKIFEACCSNGSYHKTLMLSLY